MTDRQGPTEPLTPADRRMNPDAPYQAIPEPATSAAPATRVAPVVSVAPVVPVTPVASSVSATPYASTSRPAQGERQRDRRGRGGMFGIAAVVLLSAMFAAGGTAALVAGPLRSDPSIPPAGAPAVAAAAAPGPA